LRSILTVGLALILSTSGWAQERSLPLLQEGSVVVDNAGNLVAFDFQRNTTGVTITGWWHSFYAPQTRVTLQQKGTTNNLQTVTYDASLRVVGVGDAAIYAIATVYTVSGTTLTTTQSLIAIRAGQTLPTGPALSGFPSLALTSPVDVKVGPSDYIALVSATSTSRTAQVVHFNSASSTFDAWSSATLP
jgi:hypothetical protein